MKKSSYERCVEQCCTKSAIHKIKTTFRPYWQTLFWCLLPGRTHQSYWFWFLGQLCPHWFSQVFFHVRKQLLVSCISNGPKPKRRNAPPPFFFLRNIIETFDPVHFLENRETFDLMSEKKTNSLSVSSYTSQCFSSYSEAMRVHWLLSNHLLDFIAGFQSPAVYSHPWTRFPLIINQWSIKQAICPIRAGGPSRPRMAYLAVWLERSDGNGYACIIDQNQVFKHLSHLSRSVRPFRFPSRTSHRLWKTGVQ